jgi:hypothetical protein
LRKTLAESQSVAEGIMGYCVKACELANPDIQGENERMTIQTDRTGWRPLFRWNTCVGFRYALSNLPR